MKQLFKYGQIWEQNDNDIQEMKVISLGNNLYSLQSKIDSNYYIDIKYGKMKNETNVWIYEGNNNDAQKFYIVQKNYIFCLLISLLSYLWIYIWVNCFTYYLFNF